ncbi:DoxX family protein [Tautonia plasticadhaerens]|uniref:DoxX n=1 Tax=Tautonia plasticadhaerens TaxID=2527974 RepID=A0A518HC69_9BACT|nr:DoxX family protein [Tautonia plasticadhaerens]QDV38458.1 hypothetical protein ElP_64130 [Tautonia plasticadhaerens]
MNPHRGSRIAGLVLHLLIGGLMIFAGSMKALGLVPEEAKQEMAGSAIADNLVLIGTGELASAILLIVPRTLSLGVLLTSGFWGGAICMHLSQGDSYVMQSALLALTWVGAWLRCPALLSSFRSGASSGTANSPASVVGDPS